MYADDVQEYHTFNIADKEQALSDMPTDMTANFETTLRHSLILNPSKSTVQVFTDKRAYRMPFDPIKLTINDVPVTVIEEVKGLGLIDRNFDFNAQVLGYAKSAYYALKLIYPHHHYMSRKIRAL